MTYAQLLLWYPIKSIRDEAEYDAAVKIAGALAVYDHLNEDQERYLDTLSTLIEVYEDHHITFDWPEMSGIEILKGLIEEHGMTVSDFARLIGVHRSLGTRILNGERNLTVGHIRILADRFKVAPELFMKTTDKQVVERLGKS
ncbi:MAG: helix-turn-helix domain-containing protein [Candidatus Tectomicrobia bacterium]|nr:helix-turn-helix domain-containing protein [Candidatus Tectomicrobia bacterium]